ncbi:hypothetical protein [Bradyrhizobium valentinum]|uniref:hypothetical protein n=1 Tax=Bradyrhizobium valentinum TaxID=1518501 RepID=UPI0012E3C59C|nr:hypothetical protein [Bradyrhizobium valentinum]
MRGQPMLQKWLFAHDAFHSERDAVAADLFVVLGDGVCGLATPQQHLVTGAFLDVKIAVDRSP